MYLFFLFWVILKKFLRSSGYAFEVNYCSLGKWWTGLLWIYCNGGKMAYLDLEEAINNLLYSQTSLCKLSLREYFYIINSFSYACCASCFVFQVEDFIRAIFTDSSLRRECLQRIQSTIWYIGFQSTFPHPSDKKDTVFLF